jgi:hypothetical protein
MENILENCINNPCEAFTSPIDEPMTWDASSASLSYGNDLKILIPTGVYSSMLDNSNNNKYLKLELKYSCLGLDEDISNLVLSLNNINNNNEIIINNDIGDTTNHKLYESKTFLISNNGDELLRLKNISNSQIINISYCFRLFPVTESDIIFISNSINEYSKASHSNNDSYIQNIIFLNEINSLTTQSNNKDIKIINDKPLNINNSFNIKSEFDVKKLEELVVKVTKCINNIDPSVEISLPKHINKSSSLLLLSSEEKEIENNINNNSLSSSPPPTVFVCESLNIKPSDEFRIDIPNTMIKRPYKLKYEFSLPHTSQVYLYNIYNINF